MNLQHFFVHFVPSARSAEVAHDTVLGADCLRLAPADCSIPFTAEFDDVMISLNALEGGHCEPDGAFSWHSPASEEQPNGATRIGGTLHAFENKIMCVEAFGAFSADDWDTFLHVLNARDCAVVQLAERGCYVEATEFRRLLSR